MDGFASDQALKEAVHTWHGAQLRKFYSECLPKFMQQWTKGY
jgi:hypothetical protein